MRPTLALLALLLAAALGWAQEVVRPAGHVTDGANVLDPAIGRELGERLVEFERRTQIRVVVLTVPSLGGVSVEDYLRQVWAGGGVNTASGKSVVVLLAPNEGLTRIEVSRGLVERLTTLRCARIVEGEMVPELRAGRVSGGIFRGTMEVLRVLGEPAAAPAPTAPTSEPDAPTAEPPAPVKRAEDASIAGPIILVAFVLLVAVLVLSLSRRS
jgi:uncharacterized protein